MSFIIMGAEGNSCTFTLEADGTPVQITTDEDPVDGGGDPDEPPDTGLGNVVSVSPPIVVLSRGERFTFSASVTPPPSADGEQLTNKIVVWSVREGDVGGVILQSNDTENGSAKGEYTAGQIPGTYTIRARSDFDPAAFGQATVIVKRVGITLSPAQATLQPGDEFQFSAVVSGAINPDVAWGLVEGPGAAGIVTNTGRYQANAVGVFHLKATSVEDPTVSTTATITVGTDDLINIEVCPGDATIAPGDSLRFKATPSDINWSVVPVRSQPTGGAAMTGEELFAGPNEGEFVVRATSTLDPSKYTDATIRVRTPESTTLRGRVIYNGSATGKIFVTGEGGWAGTVLAEGSETPWLFRLRGARAEAQPRWVRAWIDTLGTGTYVPGVSPTGLIDLGSGPLPSNFLTIYVSDVGPPSAPPQSTNPPFINVIAGNGALVCVPPVLLGGYEAAESYDVQISLSPSFDSTVAVRAVPIAGPRCVHVDLEEGLDYYFQSQARRGALAGGWSPAVKAHIAAMPEGGSAPEHVVVGNMFFSERPDNAIAYVGLVPFEGQPDPTSRWVQLTSLTNPSQFTFSGVENGKYRVNWALDFNGNGELEVGDVMVEGAAEVFVDNADVGNVTLAIPTLGAFAQLTTHNQAGPGMSVNINAMGFSAPAWQHTLSYTPAPVETQPPVDLSSQESAMAFSTFVADDALSHGAAFRLNMTRTIDSDEQACTHEVVVNGVVDPVSELRADTTAPSGMFKPVFRWNPPSTLPYAPSLERYELTFSGDAPELPKTERLAATPSPSWSPVNNDLPAGLYELTVTAVDSRGNTSTRTLTHAVVGPPSGVSIQGDALAKTPTIRWTPPVNQTGLVDYHIVIRSGEDIVASFFAARDATSAKVSAEAPLEPGNYSATVATRNAWDQSSPSAPYSFSVIAPVALTFEPNTSISTPILHYTHSNAYGDVVRAAMRLTGSTIGVPLTSDSNDDNEPIESPFSDSIELDIEGEPLLPGSYELSITVFDEDGRYAVSSVNWDVLFGAPSNLNHASGRNVLLPRLTWSSPVPSSKGPYTYDILIERASSNGGSYRTWEPLSEPIVVSGATAWEAPPGTFLPPVSDNSDEHRWRVRAYDSQGHYSESMWSNKKTETNDHFLSIFHAPTNLNVTMASNKAEVSWEVPNYIPEATKAVVTIISGETEVCRREARGSTAYPSEWTSGRLMCDHELGDGVYDYSVRLIRDSDDFSWLENSATFCLGGSCE